MGNNEGASDRSDGSAGVPQPILPTLPQPVSLHNCQLPYCPYHRATSVSPLEQFLEDSSSRSPPYIKDEPTASASESGNIGQDSAESDDPLKVNTPALECARQVLSVQQQFPALARLSGNLGLVGLHSTMGTRNVAPPVNANNPGGLVDVFMAATAPRPQRRANNPHSCPVCGRMVLFRSEFEKHMRTHTGEKPFGCHLCSYRSAQRSNLNVHLKSVHKVFNTASSSSHGPPWDHNPEGGFPV
ncbi:hypothetical protein SK128_009162 [Halocaridina rubra]|uniref:C2H2-type domain-containing protein n=1 Tax=Halocaridina rubra TaxID=373956 RepID=A0AAN8X6G9_HALRR